MMDWDESEILQSGPIDYQRGRYFHGTSEKNAKRIETEGQICTPEVTGTVDRWGSVGIPKIRKQVIYVTSNMAVAEEWGKAVFQVTKLPEGCHIVDDPEVNLASENYNEPSYAIVGCKCVPVKRVSKKELKVARAERRAEMEG